MLKAYQSSNAVCPFYIKEDGEKIFCEGIQRGNRIQMAFTDQRLRGEFRQKYCCSFGYKDCPIAKMLFEKNAKQ